MGLDNLGVSKEVNGIRHYTQTQCLDAGFYSRTLAPIRDETQMLKICYYLCAFEPVEEFL